MSERPIDFNDFLDANKAKEEEARMSEALSEIEESQIESAAPELDVQKAVVEALAEDKAILNEEIDRLARIVEVKDAEIASLKEEIEKIKTELELKESEKSSLGSEIEKLKEAGENAAKTTQKEIENLKEKITALEMKEFEVQERNPNSLALLDRDVDLPDRFMGETRDQVLEVIKEAREKAEADGRIRRAQILESVLVANEPSGNLEKKRNALEKFFNENGNIVNGTVIEELT